jgi:EmrB/QacA subfamily drug resistance transporter
MDYPLKLRGRNAERDDAGDLSNRRGLSTHTGFGALLAILFLTFLDNTVISAVLAKVQAQLHAGISDLQWIVGGYALAFASLMLICGSLGDNYGRKRVMIIGVAIFCGGSILCGLATTSTILIIGRVIMGIGAAASEPSTLSMIRHIYPDPRQRARALGSWAAVSGLALAMGPVIGATLVGAISWRAIFWGNLIFGVIAIIVATKTLPESSDPTRSRPDYAGFFVGAVVLGTATFATISGETQGYLSSSIVTLYVVSGLAIPIFVLIEHRVKNPMLNLSFFRRRPFTGSTFIAFASYFSIFSIFFFVALYLEIVASVSAFNLAIDFLPMLAGMVIASLYAGRWVGAVGTRVPMMAGCFIAAAGVLLTDIYIDPTAGISTVGWTMGIAGIGFGTLIVPVTYTALASVPAAHSGMAASANNTSRELGAVAGVAILGSIVNGQLTVNLVQRLAAIRHPAIPIAFRSEIIAAVTAGSFNSQAKGLSGRSSAAVQAIIKKVVQAAYAAFTHGLNLALTISFALLLLSGTVSYATGTKDGSTMFPEDSELALETA